MSADKRRGGLGNRQADRSPMANVLRRVLGKPTKESQLLTDLPEPISGRCHEIVKRTRLRLRERIEIARELGAHCRDALDAGRGAEDVASTLGEPKPVARLLRRGMLRKRHPIDRAVRFAALGTTWTLAGLIVLYIGWSVRFYMGEPTISTNYYALLNERAMSIAPEDRAWPIYRDVLLVMQDRRETLENEVIQPRIDSKHATDPEGEHPGSGLGDHTIGVDHPDYADIAELYRQSQDELEAVRRAARLPGLGYLLGYESVSVGEGRDYRVIDTSPPAAKAEDQPLLINGLLISMGTMRGLTRDLAFDAMLAAREGDALRTEANIEAILGIARHAGREPFLISALSALAMKQIGCDVVMRVIHEHPGLLDESALARTAHRIVGAGDVGVPMALDSEAMMFDDFLQRMFTDDGDGGGRVTATLLDPAKSIGDDLEYGVASSTNPIAFALKPIVGIVMADRKTLVTVRDRFFGETLEQIDQPAHVAIPRIQALWDSYERYDRGLNRARYWPIHVLMPAVGRAVSASITMELRTDAALVSIAIENHRLSTGQIPASLDQLVPGVLPGVPEDPFDEGGTIRYRLTEDGPILYSLGEDGDDDGGVEASPRQGQSWKHDLFGRYAEGRERADGDWVLFPPDAGR